MRQKLFWIECAITTLLLVLPVACDSLDDDTTFVATITVGVESAGGVALAQDHSWTFSTGDTVEPGQGVDLGVAGDFVILAKSGISTVPTSVVTGDIGVSPAAASYITGFSLTLDASNEFSTSAQVTGDVYASDYAPPTPVTLTTAIGDMELALTVAAGQAPDVMELGAGNIGGMTLYSGVYKWGTGLLSQTTVNIDTSAVVQPVDLVVEPGPGTDPKPGAFLLCASRSLFNVDNFESVRPWGREFAGLEDS